MASVISIYLPHIAGQAKLNGVILNGVTYTAPTPFVLESANVGAITAWLNSLGINTTFFVTYSSSGNLSYLNIVSECDATFDAQLTNQVFGEGNDNSFVENFTFNACNDTVCGVEFCDLALKVQSCTYEADFSALVPFEAMVNANGWVISTLTVENADGVEQNVFLGFPPTHDPLVTPAYNELVSVISSMMADIGFTGIFPLFSGTSIVKYVRMVIGVDPSPMGTSVTVPFIQSNCNNTHLGNPSDLFPILLGSWDVNGTIVNMPATLINNTTELITAIGNVSGPAWQYAAPVFFVDTPYSHGSPRKITLPTHFNALTAYIRPFPEAAVRVDYTIPLFFEETNCATVEEVNIRAALVLDCNQPDCLLFADTTGEFDAQDNMQGYGGPNYPAFANVQATEFVLQAADGTLLANRSFNYLPNANKTQICLSLQQFGLTLDKGTSYKLVYKVYLDNGTVLDCMTIPFVMPCCGDTLESDLEVSFATIQQNGCKGILFVDTTGTFSTDKPTGYCGINPCYSDIDRVDIIITFPDMTQQVFSPDWKPSATQNVIEITPADLGLDQMPVGVYEFEYIVWGSSLCVLGRSKYKTLLYCRALDCMEKTGKKLLAECGECKKDRKAVDEWLELRIELDLVVQASLVNIECVRGKVERILKECLKWCSECSNG